MHGLGDELLIPAISVEHFAAVEKKVKRTLNSTLLLLALTRVFQGSQLLRCYQHVAREPRIYLPGTSPPSLY